ncbi:MAG: hypothetical protein Q9182_000859 [Xanthomendoza sp. 2 TL-2023]
MTSYDPRVTCRRGSAPPVSNCQDLLDTMASSQTPRNYGRKGDPRAYVQLPKEFFDFDQECIATVRTTGQLDVSSGDEIWQAIAAVSGMCVRFGKIGTAFYRGKTKQLSIDVDTGGSPRRGQE